MMDIIGIAVVGGGNGDNGLQLFWLHRRHLQGIEAAPGDTHHAHIAVAPGLLLQPLQDLHGIVQFALQVLVLKYTLGIPTAAQVHTHTGNTIAGEIGMGDGITVAHGIAFAVGNKLQHRGHRGVFCRLGNPQLGGKLHPVIHWHLLVLNF